MDDVRFDRFARVFGREGNRRTAVKLALGGAIGALGLAAADDALAGKKPQGKRCRKNKNCGRGLRCQVAPGQTEGTCEYPGGCGKKNDFCKRNRDCCGGFTCTDRKCQRR